MASSIHLYTRCFLASNRLTSYILKNRTQLLYDCSLDNVKLGALSRTFSTTNLDRFESTQHCNTNKFSASQFDGARNTHSYLPMSMPETRLVLTNQKDNLSILDNRQIHTLTNRKNLLQGHLLTSDFTSNKIIKHNFSLSAKSIMESSPQSAQPYLRLIRFDKPIGTMLLFWPCTWSIGLATQAGHLPDPYYIALFGFGSFCMRSAGCIINDMWDRDFDKQVDRCKTRPLASGELSMLQAWAFLGLQFSGAAAVLFQFNMYSILLGLSSLSLVCTYPLAKRFTHYPQFILGFTFNFGALLGYSAVVGYVDWLAMLPLYAGCIAWTVVYDTIYANQDKADDVSAGVKSTALTFAENTKPILSVLSALSVLGVTASGYLTDQTLPFYIGVSAFAAHLAHQVLTVDLDNPKDCGDKFNSNNTLGLLLFLGIMAGSWYKPIQDKKKEEQAALSTAAEEEAKATESANDSSVKTAETSDSQVESKS